jgi:dTDP-glucose 4,6-dehydratase
METSYKKNCIISGCSGFIGPHILEYFLKNTDWSFICPCSWKHKGTPERITEIFDRTPEFRNRVKVITHDLTIPFTEHTISTFPQIDYIINVASDSHVYRSIEEPVKFIQNNTDLVLTMLELARIVKPKVFFQISTDEVYGSALLGTRYKEWSVIKPSNAYASSKAAQEAHCIAYWRTYNVPLVITNTVNNFGENQDFEKYLSKLIRQIYNNETVTIHGNDNFIGGRFYIYVDNHADAILYIIKNIPIKYYKEEQDLPLRFNVTSDDEFDNREMAKLVADLMGKELKYKLVDFHTERPGHDRRYALDGTKLKETGWVMPFKFRESLEKYIKWSLENKRWL